MPGCIWHSWYISSFELQGLNPGSAEVLTLVRSSCKSKLIQLVILTVKRSPLYKPDGSWSHVCQVSVVLIRCDSLTPAVWDINPLHIYPSLQGCKKQHQCLWGANNILDGL